MQRGQCSSVAPGYALKTLKPLNVIDEEATMVPRQAALWERVQCVAPGDGEVNLPAFHRLALRHHRRSCDRREQNQAIESLNARAKTDADKKLVLKAVLQQTRQSEKTLR